MKNRHIAQKDRAESILINLYSTQNSLKRRTKSAKLRYRLISTVERIIKLEYMLAGLLIFALVGCMGLLAALRPEIYARYFLAEYQRRALSGKFSALSFIGWIIFTICTIAIIVLPFGSKLNSLAPVFSPLFFLVCPVAYLWWGVGLVRQPESFLKRTIEPWNRVPAWAIKVFGIVLLLGAVGFFYGFAVKLRFLLR